ncbi:NADH:flavin oxidoreductase/NADH oxidase [Desertivibrio insolitus]|uniref:NADH:flavin oxidoreductase/NADH oxidase n=1 Tax=Herbiconiux sp. SYSU D00978 TaxID=2812562 RepID=UPI001A966554|nr:NADH:flavin oxidoreductase/NADH oxidase [Herbiconiux sp. SYSU D00978]
MTGLFDELTLRGTTFRNRLWIAPMCQYSVERQDGVPTPWHHVHLGGLARGGSGLVIAEATAVVPEGRITPQDTGIWTDQQRDAWKPIVDTIHTMGAAAGIQLAHAGRKASTYRPWSPHRGTVPAEEGGWTPVAPSAVAFTGYAEPRALDAAELPAVVEAFVAAARRSLEAGFDVLEIHAAHGYLLHQFLSPLSNHREDAYGGSLENRARLLLEITRAVRAEIGQEHPLFVRFSATDWAEDGWSVEDTATVSQWVTDAGADFIDVSSGGLVAGVRIPTGPGYQVEFATRVRELGGVQTSAVGLITEAQQADEIVRSGRADAVMVAREALRDPHVALRWAHELGVDVGYVPRQYERAMWV